MSADVAPDDLDDACLAAVLGTGPVPEVGGERIHPIRLHTAAIRALALATSPACDGIHLTDVQRFKAGPDDVLVVYVPGFLEARARAKIREGLDVAFPSNRVLILEGGVGLEIVNAASLPPAPSNGAST